MRLYIPKGGHVVDYDCPVGLGLFLLPLGLPGLRFMTGCSDFSFGDLG